MLSRLGWPPGFSQCVAAATSFREEEHKKIVALLGEARQAFDGELTIMTTSFCSRKVGGGKKRNGRWK